MFCVIIIIGIFVQGISCAHQSFVLSVNETVVNVTAGDSFLIVCVHPNEWQENTPVTWFKDEVAMEKDEFPRIIMSNLNLQFERVSKDDAGVYACDVKDYDGQTRFVRHGTLIVKNKKVVVEDYLEEDEISSALRDRNMSCEFIEPTVNNNNNNNSTQLQEQQQEIEQEDTTLATVVDSVSVPYLCFDISSKKKKLMTHYLAKPAGSTVTIFCNARGHPKPTIQWYKNDKPFISYGYQHRITKQGLLIQDSNPSDAAMYKCEASNGNQTISYEIEYLVQPYKNYKPQITPLVNKTVLKGGNFTLNCSFESDYPFGMAWIRGRNLTNINIIESRTNEPDLKLDNHLLVIENLTMDDEGWYSCVAGNSYGRSLASAYIRVVTELIEPVKEAVHSNHMLYGIFTLIACTVFSVTLFLIYSMWKCQVRKSHSKPGLNFIKQVMIERRATSSGDDDRAIMIPEVNIKNVKSNKGGFQEYELPLDLNWEFPRNRLELGSHIGEGAFGVCHQAIADGIIQTGVKTIVAVKSLKKTHTDGDMIDLMSEMETMKALGRHTNIINLLGCCTHNGELLVIMEMAQEGNLKDYLRNYCYQFDEHKKYSGNCIIVPVDGHNNNNYITEKNPIEKLTFADLMSIAFQVARGMSYLVQKKYVHRDLAARNILICTGKVVKIADFGMARSTFTNDYYRKKSDGRVPLRWMAPETIFHRIYTTQSDVWSYGVLLWEIVTLGATPYPSMPDVNGILSFLQSGKRMEKPENCPTELYLIMRDCWIESPSSRPSFDDLVEDIGRILTIASGTEYLDLEEMRTTIDYENTEILTPPSSPETSVSDFECAFDPDFLKTFA